MRRYLYPDYPVAALAPLARVAWLLSEVEFEHAPGGARVPLRARGDDLAEPTRRAILGQRALRAHLRGAAPLRELDALDPHQRGLPVPPVDAPAPKSRA